MEPTRAETAVSSWLKAVLNSLPQGTAIEDSEALRELESALEFFLSAELAKSYPAWRYESLDAFRFSVARKVAADEAEFIGLCLLISDQCWTPLHLRLRAASRNDTIDSLDLKLGEAGPGPGGMTRTPYGSSKEATLLHGLAARVESVEWAYAIRRGAA